MAARKTAAKQPRLPRAGDWFRQPGGGLNCAATDGEAAQFAARGWTPVTEAAAVKEVNAGHQARLQAAHAAAGKAIDEDVRAAQQAAMEAGKKAAARKLVETAGLTVTGPQAGPAPTPEGDAVAATEHA